MNGGSGHAPPTLLAVVPFAANTGMAWDRLEELLAEVAASLSPGGIRSVVAYPRVEEPPARLSGSPAEWVELDARLQTARSIVDTARYVRSENVQVMFFVDRRAFGVGLAIMKMLGVDTTIVHSISSGTRTSPRGVKRLVKWSLARTPLTADLVLAVSDFVRQQTVTSGLFPADRVVRLWNGVRIPDLSPDAPSNTREQFGIAVDRPLVASICRASADKGVDVLFRGFDRAWKEWPASSPRPVLIYVGDGPQFPELRELRESLESGSDILMAGYVRDAISSLSGADVHVAPSVWEDAFPYAVLEPMACGCAVVATRVGGIPEQIVDGESGLLVPPGDPVALSDALRTVLLDRGFRERLGSAARSRVESLFSFEGQVQELAGLIRERIEGARAIGPGSGVSPV